MKIVNSKLISILESLPFAIYTSNDDLFCGGDMGIQR